MSTEFEVAAYVRKSSDTDGPAFVFEHVTGHPGWRLAAGLYGTMARLPIALGCPMDQVVDRYGRRAHADPTADGDSRRVHTDSLTRERSVADHGPWPVSLAFIVDER